MHDFLEELNYAYSCECMWLKKGWMGLASCRGKYPNIDQELSRILIEFCRRGRSESVEATN